LAALAALILLVAAGSAGAGAETAPLALAPHQALYTLSLKSARGNVAINNASGQILYNFGGNACDGYSSDFHQVSELNAAENNDITNNLRSTTWESGDGTGYRFRIETRTNDEEPSIVDGMAERRGDSISVRLKQPAEKTLTLPGDVVFPTQQIQRVIAAAREGKSLLELKVYDGSDGGEKVYSTFAVIGQPIAASARPASDAADATLQGLRRWPVTVSYYEGGKPAAAGEQTPVYAMSFELYENGVSRQLALDYNDFVISGTLSKYEAKVAKPCKP
jgi:hypothetical protein